MWLQIIIRVHWRSFAVFRINHPANLEVAYAGLAEVRGCRVEQLAPVVDENFMRLFVGGNDAL